MGRTVTYTNIETPTARKKIKPSANVVWRNLMLGKLAVGYLKRNPGEPGKWLARVTLPSDKLRKSTLGVADDYGPADGATVLSFEQASQAAIKTYRGGDATVTRSITTVAEAIADYVAWLKAHKATGNDAEKRAAKLILPALGNLRLSDLTTPRLSHWRDKLAEAPALKRTAKGAKQNFKAAPADAEQKRARRASANRTLTILKAALNRAFRQGHIEDDTAWRRVQPFAKVDAARPGFLSIEEAQRLIAAADPDFRPLVHGGLLTGARYGELCALKVKDFAHGKLHIARSKSGKARDIVLTEEGLAFFESLTKKRAAADFIFTRPDGKPWESSMQARPMREACEKAGIKPAIGFHQLRHTWASHAVMNGMPLMIVARSLGHATTVMVERHYGHLAESYIDQQVKANAPRFAVG